MQRSRRARVPLTGHTGYKGAWLALWLRKVGAEVTGLAGPADATQPVELRGGPDEKRPVSWVTKHPADPWYRATTIRYGEPDAREAHLPRLVSTKPRNRDGWVSRWELEATLGATAAWHARVTAGEDAIDASRASLRSFRTVD